MDYFLEEIEKYKDEFYRYIYRNVWDTSVAEDVFSSAILVIFKNQNKFKKGTNFRAWVYKILTNRCFIANREISRRGECLEEHEDIYFNLVQKENYISILDNPKEFIEECGDEIFIALKKISTAERSAILLKDIDRFSYKEIAEILEMPVGTVMTHLARGRKKLRIELLEYAKKKGIVKQSLFIQNKKAKEVAQ